MFRRVCISLIAIFFCITSAQADTLNIYAAASLNEVVDDLISTFEETTGTKAQGVYASSAALARQIEAGAPAHVYISANLSWMDTLDERSLIDESTRQRVATNRLVSVVHIDKDMSVPISEQKDMRVVIGEPTSVPVGIYALQAMKTMGDYEYVKDNLIFADNARSVLTWVERREADVGIVYATDAQISDQVKLVATFPADAHDPIIYAAAATKIAHPEATAFLRFLTTPSGQQIFTDYGFIPAGDDSTTPPEATSLTE